MCNKILINITVFFDDPFWVGTYERTCDNKLEVAKVIFGAEPKDYYVYYYLLEHWTNLQFSPPVPEELVTPKKINPKRVQKAIVRQLSQTGIKTKAQEALRLQQEQNKLERKKFNSIKNEEEKEKKFELRQAKKKQKHRGH